MVSAGDYSGVQIEGARRLRRTLRQAGYDCKDEFKQMHRIVGGIVIDVAEKLVPVAPPSMKSAKPGLLKSTLRFSGTQTGTVLRAGNLRAPYANPIHWGWKKRNIAPTLFLSLAAKDSEPEWVQAYFEKFEEIIRKIEGK